MKKIMEITVFLVLLCIAFAAIWIALKPFPVLPKGEDLSVCTHQEGDMTYVIFHTGTGELVARNLTLDSIEKVTQIKFSNLDNGR